MDSLTLSIITVTYNAERWIEQTIQSIISQSYSGIEYIIVDGASTDATLDIIKKYEPHIARCISEPDKGLYDAMNKGLHLATGNYVWFINAGDSIYDKDTVQKIVEKLSKEQLPDIVYGETEIINAHGDSLGMRRLHAPKQLNWQHFKWGMLVCHQSFIVKRSIAENYDLQYNYTADYDWCLRCLKKANTDAVFNTNLILSKFLEAGLSTANRKASLKERYRIMCRFYGKIPVLIRHIWFALRFYTAKWIKKRI
ncbi:MAG: glycosyltransferase [Bacteroidales bacterium]|jgi:glycosyltransferase involved in cell wall biosynthesis|nr:glycosyltransferase [Bacteroidales bacterium]